MHASIFFQYAGYRAVQRLVKELPKGWRVVVLERNTHMNRETDRVDLVRIG